MTAIGRVANVTNVGERGEDRQLPMAVRRSALHLIESITPIYRFGTDSVALRGFAAHSIAFWYGSGCQRQRRSGKDAG